jgi:beta-glucosidase
MRNILAIMLWAAIFHSANAQKDYSAKIEPLLSKMTLEEKIGQLTLYTSGWDITGPTLNENYRQDVKAGRCGNLFNAHTVTYTRELQRMAVEETRLGIPLLFGYDIIHGHKTIFPIPLAEACSWDLALAEKSARLSAKEAAASGLHWAFNPMVDIARDPRWGRVAEGAGEDPLLSSLFGAAKVRGYQGRDLSDPFTLMACVKHYAAYGAAQAGRDYHFVDMSERVLRETYLPAYKAAVDAGVATVMTSFNEYDGVPATANAFLMRKILREEWGFKGFIVTDYTSINEMIAHGYSADEMQAGEQAINVGVDMDMQGGIYQNHLKKSVEQGRVSVQQIDDAVRRVLHKKHELGLFDDPYRYCDEKREKEVVESDEMMQHARDAGRKSIVLLKNESVMGRKLLPLSRTTRNIALIGPLADAGEDMLGCWHASGDPSKVVTLLSALQTALPSSRIFHARGCSIEDDSRDGFAQALEAARQADVVIMAVGENHRQSGEAASRSQLGLSGAQQALLEEIHRLGKPVIAVVMAGRPLVISWMAENVPAIVNAWHLGTMAGPAIVDVLLGDFNPSGKLVMSFPRNEGQIPIHYAMKNTGRPFDANNKYTSKYLDVPNTPLYPFGFGLSYTNFKYSDLRVSKKSIRFQEALQVEVTLSNTGDRAGEEVVQLYVRDLVGSVTRPLKELKAFDKVSLSPGESRKISFTLTSDDLRFYTQAMEFKAEAGKFKVFVGGNSEDVLEADFELVD